MPSCVCSRTRAQQRPLTQMQASQSHHHQHYHRETKLRRDARDRRMRHVAALVLFGGGVAAAAARHGSTSSDSDLSDSSDAVPPIHHGIRHSTTLADATHAFVLAEDNFFSKTFLLGVAFAVAFSFTMLISYVLTMATTHSVRKCGVPDNYVRILRYILQAVGIFISFAVAFGVVGMNLLGVLVSFGVISLALSEGIRSPVANVAAALSLQMDPNMRVGSYIEVRLYSGEVRGRIVSMDSHCVVINTQDILEALVAPTNAANAKQQQSPDHVAPAPVFDALGRQLSRLCRVPNNMLYDAIIFTYKPSHMTSANAGTSQQMPSQQHSARQLSATLVAPSPASPSRHVAPPPRSAAAAALSQGLSASAAAAQGHSGSAVSSLVFTSSSAGGSGDSTYAPRLNWGSAARPVYRTGDQTQNYT